MNRVYSQLRSWPEWHRSRRIVLAISGGVDSMVLLRLMIEINRQLDLDQKKELVIAHFNHQLRPESVKDWELIKDYIKDYEGIYFLGYWEDPARTNVEATARDARYEFFADVLQATEGDTLMTAHHLNDLGETVLMRLMRGTSLKGIRGIRGNSRRLIQSSNKHYQTVSVLRPLVNVLKEELYSYARDKNIPYLEDKTNFDTLYLRNRIRQNIIPLFEEENPQFLSNLISLTEQLEASYDAHYEHYLQVEPEFLMPLREDCWLLYIPRMLDLSEDILQIYLLILFEERLVYQIPNYNKIALKQIEQLIKQTDAPNMTIHIANNWQARRVYDYIRIEKVKEKGPQEIDETQIEIHQVNKWYQLNHREKIGIFDRDYATTMMRKGNSFEYPLQLKQGETLNFTVRHRKAGDKLSLRRKDGTSYHKKVARVMIDAKIPQELREKYWIVENDQADVLCMLPHIVNDPYANDIGQTASHFIFYQNKVDL